MRIGMRIVLILLLSVACVALCLASDSKPSLDAFSPLKVKGGVLGSGDIHDSAAAKVTNQDLGTGEVIEN